MPATAPLLPSAGSEGGGQEAQSRGWTHRLTRIREVGTEACEEAKG